MKGEWGEGEEEHGEGDDDDADNELLSTATYF